MSLHRPQHGSTRAFLIIEMVSIIIAVALGFFVTEWREDIRNARRAEDALTSITAEIIMNRAQLAERVPYYELISAALDSLVVDHAAEPFSGPSIEGWHGLNPPFLYGAAYEVASATGALSYMDLRTANLVATVYLAQEMVEDTSDWTLQAVVTGQLETYADAQRVFAFMQETSRIALDTYDWVLEELPSVNGEIERQAGS